MANQQQAAPAAGLPADFAAALGRALGATLANQGASTNQPKLVLETANPKDWENFKSQFSLMLEGKAHWDEAKKKRELKLSLKGPALDAIKDILLAPDPATPNVPTCADILTAYERRFVTARHSDVARAEYRTAAQLPDETEMNYHSRMRSLFIRASDDPNPDVDGGTQGRDLREKFILGLRDDEVSKQMLMNRPGTYAECLEMAERLTAAAALFRSNKKGKGGIHHLDKPTKNDQAVNNLGAGSFDGKCNFCQIEGHMERQCRKKEAAQKQVLKQIKDNAAKRKDRLGGEGNKGDGKPKKKGKGKKGKGQKKGIHNITPEDGGDQSVGPASAGAAAGPNATPAAGAYVPSDDDSEN